MAHLNVRERRIEAKIAYVSGVSGQATSLDHLAHVTRDARNGKVETIANDDGDLVSLAWSDTARFRDCSVVVNVVEQRGEASEERFRDVMRGTDGVVVVMDSAPDSAARNEATISLVREILARESSRPVPVMVQQTENDTVQTFDLLLDQVFAALGTGHDDEEEGPVTVQPGTTTSTRPRENERSDGGHPLLAALRAVLRDTVSEHVAQLEDRMAERLDASFERLQASLGRMEERLGAVDVKLVVLRGELTALQAAAENAASKGDLTPAIGRLDARVEKVRDELKAEIVRTIETRARAEREHLATATTTLKKAIDAVSVDVKANDPRAKIADMTTALTAMAPRFEQVESTVRQRGQRTEDLLAVLRSEATQRGAGTDERVDGVHTRIAEIVEELKKPKKSWFT